MGYGEKTMRETKGKTKKTLGLYIPVVADLQFQVPGV